MFGGWLAVLLVVVVCYDVITRSFAIQKPVGINSTMVQEAEYWLHSYLIILAVGYAYVRGAHVRIDIIRGALKSKTQCWIELIGILFALLPFSILGAWFSWFYVVSSFSSGEISKSQNGLSNLWLLKAGLVFLFVLLFLSGVSKSIRAVSELSDRRSPGERARGKKDGRCVSD